MEDVRVLVVVRGKKTIRKQLPMRENAKGQKIILYRKQWYLCCEYGNIGYEIVANDLAYMLLTRYDDKSIRTQNTLIKDYMKHKKMYDYHSSYNCLMPVIDTIINTNLNNIKSVQDGMLGETHYPHFDTAKDRAQVWIAGNWEIATIQSIDNRLYNAYYCVIKFIEWYNRQERI